VSSGEARAEHCASPCVLGSNAQPLVRNRAGLNDRPHLADALRRQAEWCARLGSPLYARLLHAAAEDVETGGPAARVLAPHAQDPPLSMVSLRLMGAVHRMVLEGRAPGLAPFYASVTQQPLDADPWPAFRDVLEGGGARLAELVRRPVQTNEVGRAAALLGGFLALAAWTAMPLRLLELGASAGLNLRWDRFRYGAGAWTWGPANSPVRIAESFAGSPPRGGPVVVAERMGCDERPVDAETEEGRLTLLSYVWPDQAERLALLRGALEVAGAVPVRLERAGAADWLSRTLATPAPGTATVVFHSVVMQYLTEAERARVEALIAQAGEQASVRAPVGWLRMERGGEQAEVRLTRWPGGKEELLATAAFHGRPVRWRGSPAA